MVSGNFIMFASCRVYWTIACLIGGVESWAFVAYWFRLASDFSLFDGWR